MVVTYSHCKFVLYNNRFISLMKRPRNGRFASETAVRRFQERNGYLDPELLKKIRWDF
jgi:hypothetical protein